jgi:hypothetical protein
MSSRPVLTGRRQYFETCDGFVLQLEKCVFVDKSAKLFGRWENQWFIASSEDLINMGETIAQ